MRRYCLPTRASAARAIQSRRGRRRTRGGSPAVGHDDKLDALGSLCASSGTHSRRTRAFLTASSTIALRRGMRGRGNPLRRASVARLWSTGFAETLSAQRRLDRSCARRSSTALRRGTSGVRGLWRRASTPAPSTLAARASVVPPLSKARPTLTGFISPAAPSSPQQARWAAVRTQR